MRSTACVVVVRDRAGHLHRQLHANDWELAEQVAEAFRAARFTAAVVPVERTELTPYAPLPTSAVAA